MFSLKILTNIIKQECEHELTEKGEIVDRLQAKATSIGKILANIERKYQQDFDEDAARMKKSPSNLSSREKRASLRIAEIPAFNASKIRKSPLTDANPSTSSLIPTPSEPSTSIADNDDQLKPA